VIQGCCGGWEGVPGWLLGRPGFLWQDCITRLSLQRHHWARCPSSGFLLGCWHVWLPSPRELRAFFFLLFTVLCRHSWTKKLSRELGMGSRGKWSPRLAQAKINESIKGLGMWLQW
jgi:hypothetical protein